MMPAAKHFDPILGIDIHIIQPPGPVPPVPVPHPFIGIVIDPFDYVPVLGATVMVNGIPRSQAGTEGKAVPSHIPIGGIFVKPPANECEIFMGSSTVEVDGDAFTHTAHPVLSCQDIGMPPPFRTKKKSKTHSLVLPTSIVLSIPAGAPVLVGGPPTISLMAMGMKAGMAALGRLGKGLRRLQRGAGRFGRAMKKLSKAIHKKAKKLMDKLGVPPSIQNKVHNAICAVTGHPVDIATGKVFTTATDFELPGPISFTWERIWFSTSVYQGPLGHGWHHNYDLGLMLDEEAGVVALRMEDGRPIAFPALEIGEEYFDRAEKLTLLRDEQGYAVRNAENLIFRFQTLGKETAERKLTSIEDLTGNSIRFRYDRDQHLQKIIDSAGRTLQVITDHQGRITAISVPHPDDAYTDFFVVRYAYDNQEDLIEAIDALDHTIRYSYEDHLLVQETDRNGLSFYFTYEGNDHTAKCIRTWGDKGIYDHKLTYIDDECLTIVENSLGHITRHYWNSNGLVTQTVDTRGGVTLTEFNEFNEKISESDPLRNVTLYKYDEFGNQTEIIGPDGAALKVKYDTLNNPVEAVDAIGGVWQWEYEEDTGRLLKRTNPLGETTAYQYSGRWLSGITDPLGGHTGLTFDHQGNLTGIRTADHAESRWSYDPLGRAVAAVDPKGNTQSRTFDPLGRVVEVQEPDGNLRHLQYDPEGNVIHVKDKQHDVSFAYSGMGRMTARTEAGTTVRFTYDTEEQLVGIRNEHGYVYRFELDENGEVAVESGFDEVRRVYTRDAAGQVTEVARASGLVTSYSYDQAGRVTEVEHSDGAAESYRYRQDGELTEATNDTSTVRFERDPLGRVLKEQQGQGDWVASEYNPLGLRIRMSSSLGAIQQIERNVMGDVTRLTHASDSEQPEAGENARIDWEAHFKRDLMGLELERSLPGGIRSKWERDKLGRPVQHQLLDGDQALRDVRYVWDMNDRLRQVIDAQKGITKYEHDALGNLASAQYGDGVVELRMPDAVGNLFRAKDRNDRRYGSAGQLLETHSPEGTTFYKYDAEGNLIEKQQPDGGKWLYVWNAAGMLDHVIRPDRQVVRFTYDALGRRVSKEFQGRTTRWVWDGNNPLHEWVEAAPAMPESSQTIGAVQNELLPQQQEFYIGHPPTGPPAADDAPLQQGAGITDSLSDSSSQDSLITWLFEPESFAPVGKIQGDKRYSIVTDYLGTPVAMVDQDGNKVWSADIGVFGKLRNVEGQQMDCPFRWPGQYEDAETGLYYNRFRYYDPEGGEYVSQDPLRLFGSSLNYYGNVHDPVLWVDELGLFSDLKDTGMGHHLVPRSVAKKLGISELSETNSIAWYPNDSANTADLHKSLHRDLIDEGVPFHGSKFTGNADDFFERASKAYDGHATKGFLKIPGTKNILLENVTPAEALKKIKEMHKKGNIPCK